MNNMIFSFQVNHHFIISMRLQLAGVSRYARRYINNTSLISIRYLSSAHSDSSYSNSEGSGVKHSAESYFKEADSSPPADSSTYQVDGSSDRIQRPHEAPSGKFSQAGVESEEYRTVDKEEPYDDLRYGENNSHSSDEGPEGKRAREGGRGRGRGRKV
ncbi:hypothetical protein B0F90DRAFT_1684376 [Multifurca ochricompacta]|uniref:Uncharacterized protein n=1 Tax=Multifurca ochricompacta TaxID=376703 RepID=A0AAD4MAV9_9AGAM|nr:hypothetical protein B0F90DRAFT_1684376 [Multifurca ochricompacta]